ncbi:succinate dehydrogenase subunit 3-2, mitochondrial-like isoform X2 [Asparagus officinalis]|uniref:succinate dehydrogenase subunit 3-2, mitochondrial-like isoform X2 n=1 Tax=Asparagus officinalis TaxID=4686 RepID=UPI00098E1858|nr:succinate dehydrogenase subunit 3-2, mitochondrial-like isoform X2 [Asparagus officinalis]
MAAESKSVALEGLCKMSMDTPFALRGYLAGANSKYQMMGGLQSSRFSSGPSIVGPTKLSAGLCGSRALHGSQVLAESSKGAFLNRPLSPHLALKKPQLSATYSISHRIFGAVLAGGIMLIPIAMKFSLLYDV